MVNVVELDLLEFQPPLDSHRGNLLFVPLRQVSPVGGG